MSHRDTRLRLIRTLARGADPRRLARFLDRLALAELESTLAALDAVELRRVALVLLGAERLDATLAALSDAAFVRLIFCASDEDACRALQRMPSARAAAVMLRVGLLRRDRLLEVIDADARPAIVRALPRAHRPKGGGERTLGAVLRLRRLFA